ncbi:DUF4232 domain-containing protein [Streptomyces sp. Je 1-79]|uniref:DUF4232 domain-containing protein n=1 Tax=Streptomyces sp. Je 1-79 TaxID=2943847 RepID=UPI0021A936A8|nr:DUF4232 domain-containing protein [Streptomyces sp. Je 1-79]MCT4356412.1 DUF4232 domain-containing protein [Streptomyces sp. Je 1-79]
MRITTRVTTTAATALLAALSLTACQGNGGEPAASAPKPSTATPSAKQEPAAKPSAQPSTERPSGGSSANGSSGQSSEPGGKPKAGAEDDGPVSTPCTGATTKVVVSKVTRPINHLLLTVTNTGSRACNAYGAPFVGFDDAQAPIGVFDESRPQAVVTLSPGESAYASVTLSGERGGDPEAHGRTVRKVSVHFAPGDGSGGSVGSGATLVAPSGTYADDDARVTYWQREMDQALTF